MKTLGYYLDAFFKAETEDQQDLAWSIIKDIATMQHEFTIKGVKIMAASRKDAIKNIIIIKNKI